MNCRTKNYPDLFKVMITSLLVSMVMLAAGCGTTSKLAEIPAENTAPVEETVSTPIEQPEFKIESTPSYANAGPFTFNTVKGYVYKSSVPYTSHIRNFVEEFAGAHYYVQAPYTTTYTSAFGWAELTNLSLNLKPNRVAYLSFGVLSNASAVDFGIRNTGAGWETYYYAHGAFTEWKNFNENITTAKRVQLNVNVVTTSTQDKVTADFVFVNSAGATITTIHRECVAPKGKLFSYASVGAKPSVRYYRFMSLVPNGTDATNDLSYMRNAKFSGLQLYNSTTRTYQTWDIATTRVEHAWQVQNANITDFTSAGTNEAISIFHSYRYH